MAKAKGGDSKAKIDGPFVTLVKYPGRRFFSVVVTIGLTFVFSVWIWTALRRGDMSWYSIAAPILFLGLLSTILQPEEEWIYTPWQESTQKYEKNIYD